MTDTDDTEARELEALSARFLEALSARERGDIDRAEDELRAVLRVEPRLAEPRLELARILLDTDRLADAEDHAREGLEILEGGGQWVDDLPEGVVQSIAHALLAEILRRKADEDDVIFGDPDAFRAMVAEAKSHFTRAAELDPSEEYSSYYAFFLGDSGSLVPGGVPLRGADPASDALPGGVTEPDAADWTDPADWPDAAD
jgi:tetratricopeptide (TPR) repeat protein